MERRVRTQLDPFRRPSYDTRMPPRSSFTVLASALESVAERFGLASMLLEHRLQRRWADIVGDAVAAHTRPDAIRFRKLHLIAENSIWLQQLTFLKPSLLEKVNAAAGKLAITDIVLRVGDVLPMRGHVNHEASRPERHPRPEDGPRGPAPEIIAEAAGHAQGILDADLRAHFTEVMARAVTNGAPKPSRPPGP
jgi:hypothetical protein